MDVTICLLYFLLFYFTASYPAGWMSLFVYFISSCFILQLPAQLGGCHYLFILFPPVLLYSPLPSWVDVTIVYFISSCFTLQPPAQLGGCHYCLFYFTASCPAGWMWINENCYQINSAAATYSSAEEDCDAKGAILAVPRHDDHNNEVKIVARYVT